MFAQRLRARHPREGSRGAPASDPQHLWTQRGDVHLWRGGIRDLQRSPGRDEFAGRIGRFLGKEGQQAVEVFGHPLHRPVPRDSPHPLGDGPVCDADTQGESSVANDVESQRPLGKQRGMLVLDRHHATGHFDTRNFT